MADKFKLVSEEFQQMVVAADEEELKAKALELLKTEQQVYKTKDEDVELQELKEKASELSLPYAAAIKELKQKRSFIAVTLAGRGQA